MAARSLEEKNIEFFKESERLTDQLLTLKSESIALNEQRNSGREAIRAIERGRGEASWLYFNNLFIKCQNEAACERMKKDQTALTRRIDEIRGEMKVCLGRLRDVGVVDHTLSGFDLTPLADVL